MQLPWGGGSLSGPLAGGTVGAQRRVPCHLGMRRCLAHGMSLLLPLLSSCAPCENPLNKKNLISINTAYTLRGFTDLINPAKDPLGSLALVGFFPILQDGGGRRGAVRRQNRPWRPLPPPPAAALGEQPWESGAALGCDTARQVERGGGPRRLPSEELYLLR